MKKFFFILFILLSLASCSSNSSQTASGSLEKEDFVIDAKAFGDFSYTGSLQKSGKISSSQEVTLSSQAVGRISSIGVKEGDKVRAGQILMSLSDNIGSYTLNLERAKNMLSKMQINYDSTKINLDKQVFDAELALEKIQNSLSTAKKNTQIDITQAQSDVQNADYTNLDSKSALDVAKLDNSIAKAELDYNNAIFNNQQSIDTFLNSYKKEFTTVRNLTQDINDFADKIFDFSGVYTDKVKTFKDFLGGNDVAGREQTKILLSALRDYTENTLKNYDLQGISEDNLLTSMEVIDDSYQKVDEALDGLQKVFATSIVSMGQLGQTDLDAYTAIVNGYQTSYGANNSGFVAYKNSVTTFLKTYKNNEASLAKQLDLLKKDREIFIKNLQIASDKTTSGYDKLLSSTGDSISSLEIQEKSALESLENAKKMREVTLRSLDNSIQDAQISYDGAAKEYSKLIITAPIEGVVGDVKVDKGQDVANGVPLISLIGDKKSEIELALKAEELPYVSVGSKVYFNLDKKDLEGTIYSITKVTDNNFNYKVNVIFDTQFDIIGGIVSVNIPIKVTHPLIPIGAIKIIGTNKGIVSLYKDGKIIQKEVELGSMYQNTVEYLGNIDGSEFTSDDQIVISDVSNYDENKHILRISN